MDNLTQHIQYPQHITGKDVTILDKLLKDFPYFQTAQLLLVKGLLNTDLPLWPVSPFKYLIKDSTALSDNWSSPLPSGAAKDLTDKSILKNRINKILFITICKIKTGTVMNIFIIYIIKIYLIIHMLKNNKYASSMINA